MRRRSPALETYSLAYWAGIVGVTIGLIAYGALQAGLIRGRGYPYVTMNIVGSSLVLVSLTDAFNMAAAISQVAWIAISLYGLTALYLGNRALRLRREEAEMLGRAFPTLPPYAARMLLRAGRWRDVGAGARLATEDVVLGRLIYLARGAAEVSHGGRVLARIGEGQLIGEVTVLSGAPATASVVMAGPGRVFEIESGALRRLTERDDALNTAIGQTIVTALEGKLRGANTVAPAAEGKARAG